MKIQTLCWTGACALIPAITGLAMDPPAGNARQVNDAMSWLALEEAVALLEATRKDTGWGEAFSSAADPLLEDARDELIYMMNLVGAEGGPR